MMISRKLRLKYFWYTKFPAKKIPQVIVFNHSERLSDIRSIIYKPEKVEKATITIISIINTIPFILMERTETFFITSQDGTTVTTKAGLLIRNILKRKGIKAKNMKILYI